VLPVKASAFYDRDTRSHKARRKKYCDRVHNTLADERAVDFAAAFDQQGLHTAIR
jgi:hypothetical protein